MKTEKVAAFDGDAVLIDSRVGVVNAVNRLLSEHGHSISYLPSDINRWDFFSKDVERRTGDLQLAKKAEEFWFDGDALFDSPIVAGAAEMLEELVCRGWELYLITSRKPHLKESTQRWFEVNLPLIKRENILLSPVPVDGKTHKAEQIEKIGAKFFVEDDPKTLEYLYERFSPESGVEIVAMGTEWNKEFVPRGRRITGWAEFFLND